MSTAEFFSSDFKFKVVLTKYESLCGEHKGAFSLTPAQVEAHLEQGGAAVLVGSTDDTFGEVEYNPPLYVLQGAGGEFYWGEMPAEDPGEAEGPLTAAEALRDATSEYYS